MCCPARSGFDFFFGARLAGGVLAIVVLSFRARRETCARLPECAWWMGRADRQVNTDVRSERGLVALGRRPGIGALRAVAAATTAAGGPGVVPPAAGVAAAVAAAPGGATAAALAAPAAGPGDLGGGEAESRADLVEVALEDGALRAHPRLVAPRFEATLDDHPHPLLERLRNVLRSLTPDRAVKEQRVAVPPLVALAVEGAGG